MKLQRIFEYLSQGELSQVHIGGHPCSEGIRDEDRGVVLGHMVQGLTALYTRFKLRECSITIKLQDGISVYQLHPDYLMGKANPKVNTPYLLDFEHTFDGSILKIDRVLDHERNELTVNKIGDPCSFHTPTYTSLQVPLNVREQTLDHFNVVYRANHPVLDSYVAPYASYDTEIELPESHLKALIYFIASGIMNPVGMTQEFHAGNTYYAKYEGECQKLEEYGMQIDNMGEQNKFCMNGFV